MSLILEALKKSEAKRRLGEAPDLGTPFATSRRRSSVLPLLVIAIVAAGGLGWWFMRTPAPAASASKAPLSPEPATSPRVAAAAHVVAPTQAPSFDNIAPPASSATPTRMRARHNQATPLPAAPAHSGEPPQVVSIAERARSGGYDGRPQTRLSGKRLPSNMHRVAPTTAPTAPNTEAPAPSGTAAPVAGNTAAPPSATAPAVAPVAAPTTPRATAIAPAAVVSTQPAPVPAAQGPAPLHTDAPAVPMPAATVAIASTPTPSAAAAATPTPAGASKPKLEVPFYYELPFSVRKALPALRLSMHVFAGDPAQRFVVLNDSRLAEGDKTSDEVTLREVRRDGAVLEFQGQRFFYPRDGQ